VTVLVVEDERNSAEFECEMLAAGGLRGMLVGTIAAAKRRIALEQPALLIVDLRLPDGDGRELISQVNCEGYMGKVLIVTGILGDVAQPELERYPILRKPFSGGSFLNAVFQCLGSAGRDTPEGEDLSSSGEGSVAGPTEAPACGEPAASAQEEAAFGQLRHVYEANVRRRLRQAHLDSQTLDVHVQDTLADAWLAAAGRVSGPSQPEVDAAVRGTLARIKHERRCAARTEAALEDLTHPGDSVWQTRAAIGVWWEQVRAQLSRGERLSLEMHVLDGWSDGEIAAVTRLAPASIRVMRSQALAKLRRLLADGSVAPPPLDLS
jgi:DNA-binding response OmpR family regulator